MKASEGSINAKLSRFLLSFRSTPQSTTGLSPAELMFNRKLRTRLELIKPEVTDRVHHKQQAQKAYHDRKSKQRDFGLGENVLVKNCTKPRLWEPAKVVGVPGPLTYSVQFKSGYESKRNVDHVRPFYPNKSQSLKCSDDLKLTKQELSALYPIEVANNSNKPIEDLKLPSPTDGNVINNNASAVPSTNVSVRPQRVRKTLSYLKEFVTE